MGHISVVLIVVLGLCWCATARSGCGCAKARPKVRLWFSSGLAVVCVGVLSVICAGVLRRDLQLGFGLCWSAKCDLCWSAMARPKVGLWFSSDCAVICTGVLSVICAGVLRQGQAVGVLRPY